MRGYYENKTDILGRLRKIEGQLRGLQRLVEEDTYCIDIMTQISAAQSGLRKVAVRLLDDHIHHCVAESISSGDDAGTKISEATAAVERLLKA
ncbi:MAG: metal-sensitive transcriptional regulator [Actinobacteria bacterium]|nr:MAG: metal-sensitive transcriptional regulator [Actinomycetota bacterium]